MKKAIFKSAFAEIAVEHPFLARAKFVFADDRGAKTSTSLPGLMQGIEAEDFDEVIKSAIGIPVKMYLSGDDLGNHVGAYVIGHITDMEKVVAEDGTNQLLAEAVIYKNEFPEEVEYLKSAMADEKPPGISYELDYDDSLIKNGVEWLKKIVAMAATFVRNPAYGRRTSLLALASAKTEEEFETILNSLKKEKEADNPNDKGGKIVEKELEEAKSALAEAKAAAETKSARIKELEELLAGKDNEIKTLNETLDGINQERLFESRIKKLAEVGISFEAEAEKAPKKKAFYLSLDDEAFEEYLHDITEIKSASEPESGDRKVVLASLKTDIPKPSPKPSNGLSFKFE